MSSIRKSHIIGNQAFEYMAFSQFPTSATQKTFPLAHRGTMHVPCRGKNPSIVPSVLESSTAKEGTRPT